MIVVNKADLITIFDIPNDTVIYSKTQETEMHNLIALGHH